MALRGLEEQSAGFFSPIRDMAPAYVVHAELMRVTDLGGSWHGPPKLSRAECGSAEYRAFLCGHCCGNIALFF